MMLRQSGAKKHANERTSENAREHNQAGCEGTHGLPWRNRHGHHLFTWSCASVLREIYPEGTRVEGRMSRRRLLATRHSSLDNLSLSPQGAETIYTTLFP